jgi:hypothetical protein
VEEEKEITSKDLTRKQLLLYILNDLLRGLYLAGCLFFDGLVILQLYSFIPSKYLNVWIFSNSSVKEIFLAIITVILEILAVYLEIKGYRRVWPKGSLYIGHKVNKQTMTK